MKVRVGYGLGTQGLARDDRFGDLVDNLERLGFDSLWLSERITSAAPDPTVGLAPGRQAIFSFLASRSGVYRIVCLIPGYERAGMWDVLQISSARLPSVTLLRAYPS